MNDILLIAGPEEQDDALVAIAAASRPARVTVLIQTSPSAVADPAQERARSDRLARLMSAVERATGAIAVGLLGDCARLDAGGYDAVLSARRPIAA